ncbi:MULTISPECIES: hypothetical protein [unclassified Chryseobacterium]|uniref:hypothetical protein n=1 Tax=unclassified Chryseobacterium TaxID=2593645 RepID=UPI0028532E89|nr:hypothetical protein [Chryseobacterium sp. CFS7]MDR4892249.1 hypothetical protein [Chryseobacterium sp. CFS7]
MEKHQEKQEIFDQYAQSHGYQKWEDLVMFSGFTFSARLALITHMYAACDLVQEEQQKRIAEKEETISGDDFYFSGVSVEKIINPENKIS